MVHSHSGSGFRVRSPLLHPDDEDQGSGFEVMVTRSNSRVEACEYGFVGVNEMVYISGSELE